VLVLIASRPGLAKAARDYRNAVEEVQDPKGKPDDAITDAAGALQAMLEAMGAEGNSLSPLFKSARGKGLLGPYDGKLAAAVEALVDWVSADRSGRGDAHGGGPATRADAWLTVRIVGALLLRLEPMTAT
jgi:hypothetical protein